MQCTLLQDPASFYEHYAALNTPENPYKQRIFETPYPNEPHDKSVKPIHAWEGSIFSVYSREAADWEGSGYGPLLMTPAVRGPCKPVMTGIKFATAIGEASQPRCIHFTGQWKCTLRPARRHSCARVDIDTA